MNNSQNQACRDFEKDIWLFVDNDLSAERNNFYASHLSICGRCKTLLNEVNTISGLAKDELSKDILDAKFDKMIEKASKRKRFDLKELIFPNQSSEIGFVMVLRVATVAVITVATILFSLSTERPNPIKNISKDILDWEGRKINQQIFEISNRIIKVEDNQWNNSIELIDNGIEQLEKSTDINSF